jgi:hypothetical protein
MSNISYFAQVLQTTFAQSAEQANEQTHAVVRIRKFNPVTLAQSFILALLKKPSASGEDVALMAASCGVEISPQACEQRYSQALCDFFKTLLFNMVHIVVQADEALASLLERFSEVKLIDSSSIQLPDCHAEEFPACGGKGSGGLAVMKLQTELDLRTGQLTCIQPEPGKSPDQGTNRQQVQPREGSLRIADLGYFSIPVLQMIALAKAYFLTRIQHVIKIHVEEKKQSLIEWLNRQPETVVDRTIGLGGSYCFNCRLIAWRVPEEIANRRRAQLRAHSIDKTGRQPSQASLAACDWEFLVTNLSDEQLSVKEAIVLYRSRWQIELLFKRWKSHCEIDRMDGRNAVMKMTRLWVRLCGAVVQHWLTVAVGWSATETISFAKLAKLISDIASELASNLKSIESTKVVITKLIKQAKICCQRTKRKKRPGTIELLRNPELLDYSLN